MFVKTLPYPGNNIALAVPQSNLLCFKPKLLSKLHSILTPDRLHTLLHYTNTLAYIKPKVKSAKLFPFLQPYTLLLSWHTSILLRNTSSLTLSTNLSMRNKPADTIVKTNSNIDII